MRFKILNLLLFIVPFFFFITLNEIAHAELSLTQSNSIIISTIQDNVTGCSCPPNGAPSCPAESGMAGNTILKNVTASLGGTPPGFYTYTLTCTSPSFLSASAYLRVSSSVTAPTTAPSLFINGSPSGVSGTLTTPWTLSWSGGNNSPTHYQMKITGPFPGMDWANQPNGAMSNGPNTIGGFGLGAGTYNFWVRACNSAGCGPQSNQVTFTASAPAPTVNINFSMRLDSVKKKLHQVFSKNETKNHLLANSAR